MGNLRSLRRSVARHPLQVWRAKKKTLQDQAELEAKKVTPFPMTEEVIKRLNETLKNESQSKQEETASPSTTGESGNVVSGGSTGQSDPVAPEQTV